jgi:hypothetical protein
MLAVMRLNRKFLILPFQNYPQMRRLPILPFIFLLTISASRQGCAWGFFAHRRINRLAIFTLPPRMMLLYKANIEFVTAHATDPDKLRYVLKNEGAHHYIDIDHYGIYPYTDLPRKWDSAVHKFSKDSLLAYGIVPWYVLGVYYRLTEAFKRKDQAAILKLSAYLGHYTADACVPLHANSNYDGQMTGQKGIHALWESNIPELLADSTFNLWVGKAEYIENPGKYIWKLVLESAAAADTVLRSEKMLAQSFPAGSVYAFISRNGQTVRSFSLPFVEMYNQCLNGMVARRMRRAIHAVASLWYTAWVNAGQPNLRQLTNQTFSPKDLEEFILLDEKWHGAIPEGRKHE